MTYWLYSWVCFLFSTQAWAGWKKQRTKGRPSDEQATSSLLLAGQRFAYLQFLEPTYTPFCREYKDRLYIIRVLNGPYISGKVLENI